MSKPLRIALLLLLVSQWALIAWQHQTAQQVLDVARGWEDVARKWEAVAKGYKAACSEREARR